MKKRKKKHSKAFNKRVPTIREIEDCLMTGRLMQYHIESKVNLKEYATAIHELMVRRLGGE